LLIVSAALNGIGPNMSSAGAFHVRHSSISASPSARSPDQQPRTITNDLPRIGSGTSSNGGTFISTTDEVSSSLTPRVHSLQRVMTSRAISAG